MLTGIAHRRRSIMRPVSQDNESSGRYVDISVDLHVVRVSDAGRVLITGARPMEILRTYSLGGVLDTKAEPPRVLAYDEGPAPNPRQWYCSEDQERLILHNDAEPIGKLALGGMGAGKTTAGVMWLYVRWLENLGTRKEIGITAPTETRLSLVLNELFNMWPSTWLSYNGESKIATLADGFRLRGVSTFRQSEQQGSRVQAFNWVGALMDEIQDSIPEFDHIMARLRSKADGKAKRIATATAKDFPQWRTLKDKMLTSGDWTLHSLLGPASPFVHPDHWERMKRSLTDRDYRRLVLAEDLPSESRLYSAWDRKENLRPIPLGARKVTSIALSRKTGDRQDALLMGHDPGAAKAGTVWLDAYTFDNAGPARAFGTAPGEILWWVRWELFTLHATTEQHATQAMEITRKQFGCNMRADAERAHVRCQPLGAAEDKPDLSTFGIWKRIGFVIKAAQYSKAGRPTGGDGIGQIKKESRIGMINSLLCNAEGKRRLFVECDDRGVPVCPQLVAALETMERDHRGRAETEEKDVKYDKSDLPAALGYALWPFERELALALRADIRRGISV